MLDEKIGIMEALSSEKFIIVRIMIMVILIKNSLVTSKNEHIEPVRCRLAEFWDIQDGGRGFHHANDARSVCNVSQSIQAFGYCQNVLWWIMIK